MTESFDDALGKALEWTTEGRRVAVATVVDTWGSSPRPRGSELAVRDDGLFAGSVSGGCVEGKVVEAALLAIADGAHRLLEFGVSNEEAWDVGLACGGTVRIFVRPLHDAREAERDGVALTSGLLREIARARDERRELVLVTPLDGGPARTWARDSIGFPDAVADAAITALHTDDARLVELPGGAVFVQPKNPRLTLVIVGAVHIAEPLATISTLLGYDVTIVDPRESFARAERFPRLRVTTEWPDVALATLRVDRRAAVVTLTHDPKIDDPALEAALRSPAFYVGALGSAKSHAARIRRLAERGFDEASLLRIAGPVGLRIGARSPAEIAVSIVAQMTERLRPAKREA